MKYTLTLMFLMSVFISVFGQKYNKLQKQIIKANYSVVEEKCKENLAKEGVKKRHRDVYLISLGDVALHQKRYVLAENYYNQVLETYLDKEKPNYVYDLEDKLALLYIETGNYLKAKKIITHVKFGRELHYKDNNHRKYRTLYTQAQYFHQLSKTDSARFYASQYVIQNKNLEFNHYNDLYYVGNAYKILTEIALENKSFEQALVYARKNETYQFHPWARRKAGRNTLNKVMALNLLADVYFALGKINRAEFFSTRSLKLYFKRIGTKEVSYVQLLLTKAKIHFANGQYENSKNDLIEGYNLLYVFIKEKLPLLTEYERERFYRKIHNQSRIMNAYSVEIISKNPKETYSKELTNKIFTYTFNTKGVLLSANNNFSRIANSLSEEDSTRYLYERWKREKGILSDYMVYLDYSNNKNKIDMQQELVNRLEKQINKEMLRYSSDFQDKTLNDQSIKEYLSDTDLLVNIIKVPTIVYKDSPYPSDSLSSYVYLLVDKKEKDVQLYCNKNGVDLEGKYFKGYINYIRFKIKDESSFKVYLGPIEKRIADYSRIFLVNDGIYNLLNINTLWNESDEEYLVDSKEVITLTTASDLLKTTNIVLPKKGITLFGHPVYDSQQGDSMTSGGVKDVRKDKYADLPGTETEVRHIKSSLEKHGIQTDMFLGKEASEENLKDHSPKGILHISTHGFFIHYDDDVNSLFGSGLILAGANDPIGSHREDGILNSYEASLLNLKDVDLVVLSACETGLGELKGGEGVYGLQRAFKSAGVTYAIMSLWKVDDVATEKMMSVFYEELSQMNGVRESFVKAQEQIKQTYPEPYYWGAFVLIGY